MIRVARPEELQRCLEIRAEVFVREQGVPLEDEVDGLDPQCLHFLAEEEGRAVGTARLRSLDGQRAKAERVAVLWGARGRGFGRGLMEAIEAQARAQGHRRLVLGAQLTVIPFYEALGYVAEGPVFLDAGIEHRKMVRAL